MSFLKRFTYRPELIWLARACGLRGFLRKCYFWWARPRDGIVRIEVSGTNAQFYVRTPEELRMLGKAQSGHWEGEILQFLISQLRAGDVVYDIGANVGLYTVLLAQALRDRGQVIAFEPEMRSFDRLRGNLELNALTNVHAFRVALGDYSGEGKLYFSGDDLVFSNLLRPRPPSLTQQQGHQVVEVARGDEFRETHDLPVPRIVKIDVEGYEHAVIRGLAKTLSDSACELVSCEIHPTLLPSEVKPEAILELLKSLGFSRIDLRRSRGIPEYHVLGCKAGK